jgi:hypothetical protein
VDVKKFITLSPALSKNHLIYSTEKSFILPRAEGEWLLVNGGTAEKRVYSIKDPGANFFFFFVTDVRTK